MSLRARLLPEGMPRDGFVMRTRWVGSWQSQFEGIGRLLDHLSQEVPRRIASPDDVGLYVIFLQRHRVELGLKLLLERSGSMASGHDIAKLRNTLRSVDDSWAPKRRAFDQEQAEFLDLVHELDPRGDIFRYPEARDGAARAHFNVDLEVLAATGATFHSSVLELVERMSEAEPVPVEVGEACDVLREIDAVLAATETFDALVDSQIDALAAQRALLLPGVKNARGARSAESDVMSVARKRATEARTQITGIQGPLRVFRRRLVAAHGETAPPAVSPGQTRSLPREPFPLIDFPALIAAAARSARTGASDLERSFQTELKAAQARQIDWFGSSFAEAFRAVLSSVGDLWERSKDWKEPAAKQLHIELGAIGTRLGGQMSRGW